MSSDRAVFESPSITSALICSNIPSMILPMDSSIGDVALYLAFDRSISSWDTLSSITDFKYTSELFKQLAKI
jgi:hypothetical protein